MKRHDAVRDPRIAQQAASYGDDAHAYRALWAPVLLPMTIRLLDRLPLTDARIVLDVGTGVGAAIGEIRRRAPSAHIIGVDRSIGMLGLAPLPGARAVMDAMNLAVASGSIDVAVAAFMLFHLPDTSLGLRELRRVMRKGGTLGITVWGSDADVPAWDVWTEELDASGASQRDSSSSIMNGEMMDTPDKLERLLRDAGFSSVHVEVLPLGFQPNAQEFTELQARFASRERLDSLSAAARESCIERATKRLNELSPGDFMDQSEVLLAIGTR